MFTPKLDVVSSYPSVIPPPPHEVFADIKNALQQMDMSLNTLANRIVALETKPTPPPPKPLNAIEELIALQAKCIAELEAEVKKLKGE